MNGEKNANELTIHVKWSGNLADRLGPEILTVLEIKGHVLHRVRLHGSWLVVRLNALLTKLGETLIIKSLVIWNFAF